MDGSSSRMLLVFNESSIHGQTSDDETLALQTKLEWAAIPLIQADKFVCETENIHIQGDEDHIIIYNLHTN